MPPIALQQRRNTRGTQVGTRYTSARVHPVGRSDHDRGSEQWSNLAVEIVGSEDEQVIQRSAKRHCWQRTTSTCNHAFLPGERSAAAKAGRQLIGRFCKAVETATNLSISTHHNGETNVAKGNNKRGNREKRKPRCVKTKPMSQ